MARLVSPTVEGGVSSVLLNLAGGALISRGVDYNGTVLVSVVLYGSVPHRGALY